MCDLIVMSNIDYKALGFKDTGFGCTVRATEISVWIVAYHPCSCHSTSYGVYTYHGAPAGQFWRNSPPLVACNTMKEARDVAERIFGITGSAQFATVINYSAGMSRATTIAMTREGDEA
jgi:hypothetical protein